MVSKLKRSKLHRAWLVLPGSALLHGFVVNCLHFVASYVSFITEEGFSNGLILPASIDGEAQC